MKLSFTTSAPPIGLDLGSHSIKAVQFDGDHAAGRLIASCCLPRKSPGTPLDLSELQRLCGVLDRQGFQGRDVVVAMPVEKTMTSVLELPARSGELPMEEIACAEFCRIHKTEQDAVSVSYWELPVSTHASRSTYMLAAGWLCSDANEFLDQIENAGFAVAAVDAATSAMVRGCKPQEGELTGILDLGWNSAVVGIVKSDVLIYERRIAEAGHAHLVKSFITDACDSADAQYLIQKIGLSDPQPGNTDDLDVHEECRSRVSIHCNKMVDEIRQAFSYAQHQYQAEMPSLVLTGGGAGILGLPVFLEKSLGTKVCAAEPRDAFLGRLDPSMMHAIGLARFGCELLRAGR